MIRVSGLCLAIGLISAPAFGQGFTVPEGFIVDTGPRGGAATTRIGNTAPRGTPSTKYGIQMRRGYY